VEVRCPIEGLTPETTKAGVAIEHAKNGPCAQARRSVELGTASSKGGAGGGGGGSVHK